MSRKAGRAPGSRTALTRPRGLSRETREKLFKAGLQVFARNGFDKATVEEVAEEAGLARATIYYHFNGKRDLFLFVMQEGLDLMAAEVEKAVDEAPDTLTALEALIEAHVDFLASHRHFARMLMMETWRLDAEREISPPRILSRNLRAVSRLLSRARQEGLIKEVAEATLLSAFFGLVSGAAVYYATYERTFDRERLKRDLKEMLLRGILTDHPPTKSGRK